MKISGFFYVFSQLLETDPCDKSDLVAACARALASCVRVRRCSRKCWLATAAVVLSALGTAVALTFTALHLIRQKRMDDEDWFSNYPTHDCRGDGFKGIYYNFTNRKGVQVRRCVKYSFPEYLYSK